MTNNVGTPEPRPHSRPSIGRILVSLLWGAGGIAAFAAGQVAGGIVAIVYLAYLWLLGGRWLIF